MSDPILEFERVPEEGYIIRVRPPFFTLVPQEAREHMRNAEKEMLLAFRSYVDAAIRHVEEAGRPKGKPRRKIEVE